MGRYNHKKLESHVNKKEWIRTPPDLKFILSTQICLCVDGKEVSTLPYNMEESKKNKKYTGDKVDQLLTEYARSSKRSEFRYEIYIKNVGSMVNDEIKKVDPIELPSDGLKIEPAEYEFLDILKKIKNKEL